MSTSDKNTSSSAGPSPRKRNKNTNQGINSKLSIPAKKSKTTNVPRRNFPPPTIAPASSDYSSSNTGQHQPRDKSSQKKNHVLTTMIHYLRIRLCTSTAEKHQPHGKCVCVCMCACRHPTHYHMAVKTKIPYDSINYIWYLLNAPGK